MRAPHRRAVVHLFGPVRRRTLLRSSHRALHGARPGRGRSAMRCVRSRSVLRSRPPLRSPPRDVSPADAPARRALRKRGRFGERVRRRKRVREPRAPARRWWRRAAHLPRATTRGRAVHLADVWPRALLCERRSNLHRVLAGAMRARSYGGRGLQQRVRFHRRVPGGPRVSRRHLPRRMPLTETRSGRRKPKLRVARIVHRHRRRRRGAQNSSNVPVASVRGAGPRRRRNVADSSTVSRGSLRRALLPPP